MEEERSVESVPEANTCIICGGTQLEGIRIVDQFICDACESEMVRTDVMDAKYPFFINQLKRIWYKKDA